MMEQLSEIICRRFSQNYTLTAIFQTFNCNKIWLLKEQILEKFTFLFKNKLNLKVKKAKRYSYTDSKLNKLKSIYCN